MKATTCSWADDVCDDELDYYEVAVMVLVMVMAEGLFVIILMAMVHNHFGDATAAVANMAKMLIVRVVVVVVVVIMLSKRTYDTHSCCAPVWECFGAKRSFVGLGGHVW